MKHAFAIIFASLVSCVACASTGTMGATAVLPDGSDTLVDFPDDDVVGIASHDACSVSYRILRSCHCREAEPVMGSPFPEWCRSMGYAIDSSCIAGVKFCSGLNGCHVRCSNDDVRATRFQE